MRRVAAVLVVALKPGTTLGELADLAELLKHHRSVESTRLEPNIPGLAKARPREGSATRKKAGGS